MTNSVYGLRIEGLPGAARLMQPDDPCLPALDVRRDAVGPRPRTSRLDERTATFPLQGGGGWIELSRAPLVARLGLERDWDDEQVLHPFLALTAAITAWWLGRHVLHAGAFVADGGAWGMLGAKEAGKSSSLAELASHGVPVLCDDVLVVEDGRALAGPACIDLRTGAAERFGGEALGVVGVRERFRLAVPGAPPSAPLRGWILPEWGRTIRVDPVPLTGRLTPILGNYGLYRGPRDPAGALALAALPLFVWTRPRSWEALADATSALLEAVGGVISTR